MYEHRQPRRIIQTTLTATWNQTATGTVRLYSRPRALKQPRGSSLDTRNLPWSNISLVARSPDAVVSEELIGTEGRTSTLSYPRNPNTFEDGCSLSKRWLVRIRLLVQLWHVFRCSARDQGNPETNVVGSQRGLYCYRCAPSLGGSFTASFAPPNCSTSFATL